jgi:hypothetical protein
MAVSAAVPMTTCVLEGAGRDDLPLWSGNRAILLLPAGHSNEWHQIDTGRLHVNLLARPGRLAACEGHACTELPGRLE